MSYSPEKQSQGELKPVLIAFVLTIVALALVFMRNELSNNYQVLPSIVSDNTEYLKMGQGDTHDVMSPFTRRALFPFMAYCISQTMGLPIPSAFIILDIISVFLLIYFLAKILIRFGLSPWITAIFILTPYSLDRVVNGYMPDLFHSTLTAFFFLLILQKRFLSGLIVLAVAYMVRENTLILCLVFGIIAWVRRFYGVAFGSGLVILFGTAFGSWAIRLGQPNIHHLPDFLYFGLKMPHQFLKNVFGFRIWTNTLPFGEPFKIFVLPTYLRAGDVHAVGLCYPEWSLPFFTLITLLTLFGAGPLIVWRTRRIGLWTNHHSLAIQVVFVYGLISYFLGTSIGDWVDRLIGYGWPLFWIGVPYILAMMKHRHADRLFNWSLFSLGFIPWLPLLLGYNRGSSISTALLTIVVSLAVYGLLWLQFRNVPLQFASQQPEPK